MFLANENFPKPSTLLLRKHGYFVKSIQEEMQGISDKEVMAIAALNQLIILTFDRDYGELIFRYAIQNPPSVIYFREKGNTPLFAGNYLIHLLTKNLISFTGAFTVIEENNIRQRSY